jgi:enolase
MKKGKASIEHVEALEVLDSRGHPTVRGIVTLASGARGEASVPSGASTGKHEALELRDGDPARYGGRGVLQAVGHVRGELAEVARGRDACDQAGLDEALRTADGTRDKSHLGANALLAVSMANAMAAAAHSGQPLYRHIAGLTGEGTVAVPTVAVAPAVPLPMINLLSGGKHAGGQVDFQDFLVVPRGAGTFPEAMEMMHKVYYSTLDLLGEAHGYRNLVADEGGLGPELESNEAMLEVCVRAIEKAGLRPMEDAAIAIDVAASHFFAEGKYTLAVEDSALSAGGMIDRLADWRERYPILSLEDGLAENDWEHWTQLTDRLGASCQILGDDLFVTDTSRIEFGILRSAANSVLIKVNQIGTLSEALEAMAMARRAGWNCVVSARSGETEDAWLADLAVGTGAGQIKVGSITRSERLAKYNRLLAIVHEDPALPYARDVLDKFVVE